MKKVIFKKTTNEAIKYLEGIEGMLMENEHGGLDFHHVCNGEVVVLKTSPIVSKTSTPSAFITLRVKEDGVKGCLGKDALIRASTVETSFHRGEMVSYGTANSVYEFVKV